MIKHKPNHWIPKILRVNAITLYPYVLYAEGVSYPTWVHEMTHVRQIEVYGVWRFYFIYIKEYFKNLVKTRSHFSAYYQIPFEVEARYWEHIGHAPEKEQIYVRSK